MRQGEESIGYLDLAAVQGGPLEASGGVLGGETLASTTAIWQWGAPISGRARRNVDGWRGS